MPAEAEASTRGHTRVPDSLTRAGAGAPPFRGASEAEGGGRRRSRRPDPALGAPATRSSRARRSCKRRKRAQVSRTRARSPNSAARSTRIPHARLGSARLGSGRGPPRAVTSGRPGPSSLLLPRPPGTPPRRQPQRLRALLLAATRSSPLSTLLARSPRPRRAVTPVRLPRVRSSPAVAREPPPPPVGAGRVSHSQAPHPSKKLRTVRKLLPRPQF